MAIIKPDKIDRLKSTLLASGVQQTNPRLYDVINNLIGILKELAVTTLGAGSGGGGTTNITNNLTTIQQFLDVMGNDGGGSGDGDIIMIGSGSGGSPVAATHYDAPLSDGDLIDADLIFAAGECIIVQVPV